ncbi:unnamed protein product [Ceratitis capitata]|uniref:(Mediterranean fruit fly) hypothetical protein n=1 Tax=Ceratitis capitata TaxID=7213 RepID=A0A811V907_CERCA|nr:unnamed protein product [Ceratitis capitata]
MWYISASFCVRTKLYFILFLAVVQQSQQQALLNKSNDDLRRKRPETTRPNHILLFTIINPFYPITVLFPIVLLDLPFGRCDQVAFTSLAESGNPLSVVLDMTRRLIWNKAEAFKIHATLKAKDSDSIHNSLSMGTSPKAAFKEKMKFGWCLKDSFGISWCITAV